LQSEGEERFSRQSAPAADINGKKHQRECQTDGNQHQGILHRGEICGKGSYITDNYPGDVADNNRAEFIANGISSCQINGDNRKEKVKQNEYNFGHHTSRNRELHMVTKRQ
jgi:hypothetical protein